MSLEPDKSTSPFAVCICVVRFQRDRLVVTREPFGEALQIPQRIAAGTVRLRVVRLQCDGLVAARQGIRGTLEDQ
jgi:hypothetical protein